MRRSAATSAIVRLSEISRRKPLTRGGRGLLLMAVERLEGRQLLSGSSQIAASGKSATYTDVAGDTVTITVSAGTLVTGDFTFAASGNGQQLQRLTLTSAGFAGANVTAAVTTPARGSDGLVNIGQINASNTNLGTVSVGGDLGSIDAGNASNAAGTLGLKALSVRSIGRLGLDTQNSGSLTSNISGGMGALTVKTDIDQAHIEVTGTLASVTIGGWLLGGNANNSGSITSTANMGAVAIGGSLVGGAGISSGSVDSSGSMGAVTIGGSLIGGSGNNSGALQSDGAMGAVKIIGDLAGGGGTSSFAGSISCNGPLASLTVGNSITGSTGSESANINATTIGAVTIGGSVLGGSGTGSGEIQSTNNFGAVKIIGDLVGNAATANFTGVISCGGTLASLTIGGSIVGGGAANTGAVECGNLGAVAVGGSLVGGANNSTGVINSMANIGAVTVFGDLVGGTGSVSVTSGAIDCSGTLASIKVGGSLVGGIGTSSGEIVANVLGATTIGGSVTGGTGGHSGLISSSGNMGMVTLLGALTGGTSSSLLTGAISCGGTLAGVTLAGSVTGGAGQQSGFIESTGSMGAVTIGGSVVGGTNNSTGEIESTGGSIGLLKIAGSLRTGPGMSGDAGIVSCHGTLAGVTIGGSLVGGPGNDTGEITTGGAIGPVTIAGSVIGAAGNDSGTVGGGGGVGAVTVGGSVIGGAGIGSASIASASGFGMGMVKIAGNLVGGTGSATVAGAISSGGTLAGITIGGSVIGGSNNDCGEVSSTSTMGAVTVGGSVVGGSGNGSGIIQSLAGMGAVMIGQNLIGGSVFGTNSLNQSGYIFSNGRITSVTIGGSVYSGVNNSTDTAALDNDGAIGAANDIGSLTIKGSLVGNDAGSAGVSPVVISANSQATPGKSTNLAIGSITVSGKVEFSNILAGYNTSLVPTTGSAQIGPVMVSGDWIASNLVAGAENLTSSNVLFGNANDAVIAGGNPAIPAKITSIAIGGTVFGTPNSVSNTDQFGFVADQIGSFKFNGFSVTLIAAPDTVSLGQTADVAIHLVPLAM